MHHALDVRLRLHIDDAEMRPGETAQDTAERVLREIMTVDDKVLDVQVFSWTWVSRPLSGL